MILLECRISEEFSTVRIYVSWMVGDFRRGPARGPLKNSNRSIQIVCRISEEFLTVRICLLDGRGFQEGASTGAT